MLMVGGCRKTTALKNWKTFYKRIFWPGNAGDDTNLLKKELPFFRIKFTIMKSLNFEKLNLRKEDVLSKNQMKNILGGYGGETGMCWITTYDQNHNKIESYGIFTSENCGSSTANSHCVDQIVTQGTGVYRCSYNCGC